MANFKPQQQAVRGFQPPSQQPQSPVTPQTAQPSTPAKVGRISQPGAFKGQQRPVPRSNVVDPRPQPIAPRQRTIF